MHHNYVEIFLALVFIIAAAKLAGVLAQRFGQPAVLGEIAAGLLLGPTLLAIAYWPIFPESANQHRENAAVEKSIKGIADNPDTLKKNVEEFSIEAGEAVERSGSLSNLSDKDRRIIGNDVAKHIQSYAYERPTFLEDTIKVLAQLGVLFLMFLAGLETDLKQMMRVGKAATLAAAGGVIVPMILGLGVTLLLIPHTGFYTALFAGTILCATSVSISAQTLKELGKLQSKEGCTILGAAVIDDVIGIIILSLVIAFNPIRITGGSVGLKQYEIWQTSLTNSLNLSEAASKAVGIVVLIIAICLFFSVFLLFGLKYFQKLMDFFARLPTSQGVLAFALALALFYAWAAEYIGAVAAITGTYLAGLILAQTTYHHEIDEKLGIITYSFFVPIFFINIGLEANARTLEGNLLWYTILIAFAAILGKVVGCYFGAKLGGFSKVESYRVGMGMVSRGEVGLIVASVGLSSGIIGRDIFSSMIIMVLATTLVTPALLKISFRQPHAGEPAEGAGH